MLTEREPEPSKSAPMTKDADTRRLLYDELRHRHDVQRSVSERLEGKAALVLGAALALIQFVAREPVDSWWLPPALGPYTTAGLAALVIVLPRRFEELGPENVLRKVWWWTLPDAASYLANARLSAIKANVEHQAAKVRWLRLSVVLLLLGAMMSAVHLTQGERDDGERTAGGTNVAATSDRLDAGT